MKLSEWFRKRKEKNPFKGSLVVDNPDIKIVEATYDSKPLVLAVGTSKQRELTISAKGSTDGIGGEYQTQKDLKWEVLYNPKAFPDFIPIEKAKDLVTETVAVTSGSLTVYQSQNRLFVATNQKLEDLFETVRELSVSDEMDEKRILRYRDAIKEFVLKGVLDDKKKTDKNESKQES